MPDLSSTLLPANPSFDQLVQALRETIDTLHLHRHLSTDLTQPLIGTSISSSTFGAKNLLNGAQTTTIGVNDNLQNALDTLNAEGGGSLYLKAGTYKITSSLKLYSSISIIGISPTATILNFGSASVQVAAAGTLVYSTGTVTAIASGVNVTGSGTTWTSSMAGNTLFLGTRSYVIASVTDATHLVLAEGYGDTVTFPSSYRIVKQVTDITIQNIGFKNSTTTALALSDCRRITLSNLQFISNSVGITLTNCSEDRLGGIVVVSSTGDGIQATNVGLSDWSSVNNNSNGGKGFTFNNVQDFALLTGTANGNTGNGFDLTTVNNAAFLVDAEANGGKGVEFVSGCGSVDVISGLIASNTSDGIKLTASSSHCHFYGLDISGNGGYGINVAVVGDSNNIITTNYFLGNTSGAVNDAGTSTIIRGNSGVTDNATGGNVVGKFGGTGADGALSISSGTTTIDCANAAVVIKNYTSISITGTGKLAFSNPNANGTIVIVKSQGAVTLTSSTAPMLDMSGMGGAGGASVSSGGTTVNGNPGTSGNSYFFSVGGGGGGINANAAGGTAAAYIYSTFSQNIARYYGILVGGGGGSGVSVATLSPSGTGGRGGGGLVLECGGSWNFTTASGISVAGAAGGASTGSSGGGGGGGGGFFLALYNSLTANTGTVTVSGGTGGTGGTGLGIAGGGGGGGSSVAGSGATDMTGVGGAGATGQSQISLNGSFT